MVECGEIKWMGLGAQTMIFDAGNYNILLLSLFRRITFHSKDYKSVNLIGSSLKWSPLL